MEIKWYELHHTWRYLDGDGGGTASQTCISNSVSYLKKIAEQRLGVSPVWGESDNKIRGEIEAGDANHYFWIEEMDAGEVVYIAEGELDGQ